MACGVWGGVGGRTRQDCREEMEHDRRLVARAGSILACEVISED